jgi:TonB-dependent receptor
MLFGALLLAFTAAGPLPAQEAGAGRQPQGTGVVRGSVLNAASRAYLEGATVAIPEIARQTQTDKTGRFIISDVPAGGFAVRVSYMGLEDAEQAVTVRAGMTASLDFELQSEIYKLSEFVVTGEREGNAAAIVAQKNAPNIMNIIAMDAFGNVADGNIGNFLQRLPGIAQGKVNGDIQSVSVRGMPSSMSTVSMDGSNLATANNDDASGRAFSIDIIPAELISALRLTKAPTPDMPADSLGGNINLVTKSAFEMSDRLISYRVGYNWNSYRRDTEWTPSAAFTYLDTFGARRNMGITLAGSYSKTYNTRDRLQNSLTYATPSPQTVVNTRLRLLDDCTTRVRSGASLKFDYRVNPRLSLWLGGNYTHFDYDLDRYDYRFSGNGRVADYNVVSRAAIEAGATPMMTATRTASVAPGFTEDYTELLNATVQNGAGINPRKRDLYKIALGGKLALNEGWLRLEASYGYSTDDSYYQDFLATASNIGVGVALDSARDKKRPVLSQTYGDNLIFAGANPSIYTGAALQKGPMSVKDETREVKIDWRHSFSKAGFPLAFQAGASIRVRDYAALSNTENWTYNGDGTGLAMPQFSRSDSDYGLFHDFYPRMGRWDYGKVKALFDAHPEYFTRSATDVTNPESRVWEVVPAAYLMGEAHFWNRLYLLAGVRVEKTRQKLRGSYQRNANQPLVSTDQETAYDDAFPGAHLRYTLRPNLQARASWSTSMARPGINQIVPMIRVSNDSTTGLGTVTENNPDLHAMTSDNYDISIEYYSKNVGFYTIGAFSREMKGFISRMTSLIGAGPDNGFDGQFEGYDYATYANMENARVRGVEFNFSKDLTFLPGLWRRVSVMGNVTWLESRGQFSGDIGGTQIPGFKPWSANAGATFRYKKWLVRAFYNYNAGYLGAYNENPLSRSYFFEDRTLDLNIQYRLDRRFTLFCDINNVFNYAPGTYIMNSNYVLTDERNGTRLNVGISGRF